jgi:pyridoxal 5'-phosphate synthase pdxT subunit
VAGNNLTVGVLALQGAVREHLEMIEQCGARGVGIKRPSGLDGVNGLIIPGGESTTIGKLIDEYGFAPGLKELGARGVPIFGTCAGLIILSQRVKGRHGTVLGLADVTVERNAFGRQVDSFEKEIAVKGIEGEDRPFRAVFIRAPVIEETGPGVEVMASVDEGVVMARQGTMLLGAFHPELTGDERIHRYFLEMVRESGVRS